MNKEVMFSSKTDEWSTPQELFDRLNAEFNFTLDPCADESNHKCDKYFTKEQDGLTKIWGGIRCFVILHMAGKSASGFRSAMKKVRKAFA